MNASLTHRDASVTPLPLTRARRDRPKFLFIVFVLLNVCAVFYSCDDGVVTFTGGNARVRIFNAQLKADRLDVLVDTVMQFTDLRNGELSNVHQLSSGVYHSILSRSSTDASLNGIVADTRYVLADDASYTIVVRGSTITDYIKPVLDVSESPFPAKAAIRIINATDTVYCNVLLDTEKVNGIIAEVQTASQLFAIAPGINVLRTVDAYNGAEVDHQTFEFVAGKVYNVFVYDSKFGSSITQKVKIVQVN